MNDVKLVRLGASAFEVWINGSKVDRVVDFQHKLVQRGGQDTVTITFVPDSFQIADQHRERVIESFGLKVTDFA